MNIVAYHVSKSDYAIGHIVTNSDYINVTTARGNEWVEQLLLSRKPKGAISRLECVYTFPTMELLGAYSDYLGTSNLKYYKVEIPRKTIYCPMVLPGFIATKRNKEKLYLQTLADEYWSSCRDWRFIEMLSESFEVIEQISKPRIDLKVIGLGLYSQDKRIALLIN
jgi:hypothetical protein